MNFIRNFYRKNFYSSGRRLLLDLIESKIDLVFGIILEEVGLPGGQTTIHRWWKSDHAAFYERIHFERSSGNGLSDGTVEREVSEFNDVFTLVDALDRLKLKNFSSTFRDGVIYSLAWGGKGKVKDLSIDNPETGSLYDNAIKSIKSCRWEK